MSTYVIGYIPPDDNWQKMRAVWDSCEAAGIDPPDEVDAFFRGVKPDDHGQEINLPYQTWSDDNRYGVEIELIGVPSNVKIIRVEHRH